MALQSSFPLTLDQIKQEVFGNQTHPFDFTDCINSSLLTSKTLPIGFDKFLGYVHDISFTASPDHLNFAATPSGSQNTTIAVNSSVVHIGANPDAWITTAIDSNGSPLHADHELVNGGSPSYTITIQPGINGPGTSARDGNIVIHLTSAIGNAYQTQSATTLNIPIHQDAGPANVAPTFTATTGESFSLGTLSISGTTGDIGSTTIRFMITISAGYHGSYGLYVTDSGSNVISNGGQSGHWEADGSQLNGYTDVTLTRALVSGDVININIGAIP